MLVAELTVASFLLNLHGKYLFCIVFKHLYSASSGVNRSEALPVCKPHEKK